MTNERTKYRSLDLSGLKDVAKEIAGLTYETKVWLFYGNLGAGKTTLIKMVCEALGVRDVMSSPTFAIVNEYETEKSDKVFHFDFYRIRNEEEAMDIGADEYFYSGDVCLIEWPEKVPSLIPQEHGEVRIDIDNDTQRTIAISVHDGKKENRF